MKNLLNKQENRRYRFVQHLSTTYDWFILSDLATELDCSSRVLQDDLQYLNKHFDYLVIHTSTKGIKIEYKKNRGPKAFCQTMLEQSTAYQLLEAIFLNKDLSVQELADVLFTSSATLYRLIDQLNKNLRSDDYGFSIETNPCRLTGDEDQIRYFFYRYFFEKYDLFEWPFHEIPEQKLVTFIKVVLSTMPFPSERIDFSFFNIGKLIIAVNIMRYQHGGFVDFDESQSLLPLLQSMVANNPLDFSAYQNFSSRHLDAQFLKQAFAQYLKPGLFFGTDHFESTMAQDETLTEEVLFLKETLENLATKHAVPLPNQEQLVLSLYATAHLEYQEPQSGYILYDRNRYFAKDIKQEFPLFYQDLYEAMKAFRGKIGKPVTKSGTYFYVYTVFSWWKDLVPNLRKKFDKIHVLVISDRAVGHADMIKGFIDYEFSDQLEMSFYSHIDLTREMIEEMDDDLIVSSFYIPDDLLNTRHVYISNVPKYRDYVAIQKQIEAIINERIG